MKENRNDPNLNWIDFEGNEITNQRDIYISKAKYYFTTAILRFQKYAAYWFVVILILGMLHNCNRISRL